jgi:hypothetical protein
MHGVPAVAGDQRDGMAIVADGRDAQAIDDAGTSFQAAQAAAGQQLLLHRANLAAEDNHAVVAHLYVKANGLRPQLPAERLVRRLAHGLGSGGTDGHIRGDLDGISDRQVARLAGDFERVLVAGLVGNSAADFQSLALDVHLQVEQIRGSIGQPRHLHLHGLELGLALREVQNANQMHAAGGGGSVRRRGRVCQGQRDRTDRSGCHHEPSSAAEKSSHECPP